MRPNMRLKLTAPVLEGKIAFVTRTVWRRSLGAVRQAAPIAHHIAPEESHAP